MVNEEGEGEGEGEEVRDGDGEPEVEGTGDTSYGEDIPSRRRRQGLREERGDVLQSGLDFVDAKVSPTATLREVCNRLMDRFEEEFSILAKGRFTENGFELSDEYVIPEQNVTKTRVSFEEDLVKYKQEGFNTVIHRHPGKSGHFSLQDEQDLNTNFRCSLLFSDGRFRAACLNIDVDNGKKVVVEADLEPVAPNPVIPEEELRKITPQGNRGTGLVNRVTGFLNG